MWLWCRQARMLLSMFCCEHGLHRKNTHTCTSYLPRNDTSSLTSLRLLIENLSFLAARSRTPSFTPSGHSRLPFLPGMLRP